VPIEGISREIKRYKAAPRPRVRMRLMASRKSVSWTWVQVLIVGWVVFCTADTEKTIH
jgi:hypothetical protein